MLTGTGSKDGVMPLETAGEIIEQALAKVDYRGKSVLAVIPDGTRSGPLPFFFRQFCDRLLPRVARLDFLVALGTHAPLSGEALRALTGATDHDLSRVRIYNHYWERPETFVEVGVIPASQIEELSDGLFGQDVHVTINRLVKQYDKIIICGPVFPHEVAGFSGGHKYFFPGISGREVIDFSHWLGALITSMKIIGTPDTPVRAVIERAAELAGLDTLAVCPVVVGERDLAGVFAGEPREAWRAAAELSARVHIVYLDKPVKRALSIMPAMYEDIWTGAKGMYKLEPVIEDGGEVVIYAPRIKEISYVHGKLIDEVGYHVRDYFVKQWDRFKDKSWCVLAHSTHLRGQGRYEGGVESPRIKVTLATSVPRERCERINLGYMDPRQVDLEEWKGRESEGMLVVPRAGEMLYRLRPEPKTGEDRHV